MLAMYNSRYPRKSLTPDALSPVFIAGAFVLSAPLFETAAPAAAWAIFSIFAFAQPDEDVYEVNVRPYIKVREALGSG